MKKVKLIIAGVIILILIPTLIIIFSKKPIEKASWDEQDLINQTCTVFFEEPAAVGNITGQVKLINENWIMLVVADPSSNNKKPQEVWVSQNKLVRIEK